jgi:hypothetical protein
MYVKRTSIKTIIKFVIGKHTSNTNFNNNFFSVLNLVQLGVFPLCLTSDEKETVILQGPQQKNCA